MSSPYYVKLTDQCLLKVAGKDAVSFLQGQLTCDLNQVTNQQSSLGCCCDRKGRVLFSFRIFLHDEHYYLYLPKSVSDSALAHLRKYVIIAKVNLSLEEGLILGLGGHEIERWLSHFSKIPVAFGEVCQQDKQSLICIDDHQPRFLLINPPQPSYTDLKTIALNEWQLADINQALVTIYPETQEQFIPQMLNYEQWGAVSFTKGCYVGQEIIARTQHLGQLKRHLHRLEAEVPVRIGAEIFNDRAERVGLIAASAPNTEKSYSLLAVLTDQSLEGEFYLQNKIPLKRLT